MPSVDLERFKFGLMGVADVDSLTGIFVCDCERVWLFRWGFLEFGGGVFEFEFRLGGLWIEPPSSGSGSRDSVVVGLGDDMV